jgi:hypothetical protein
MKNKHANIICGFAALAVLIIAACSNPFAPPDYPTNNTKGGGLVRIYIGEDSPSARTVQPAHNAIAGYQLTFSGGYNVTAPNTVDITEGNSAEVALADGGWTITAKAYKSGGTIGDSDDAIASGSITITLSNGLVSETVPPIILRPTGTGNGTLSYDITLGSAISGYMKLFEINGSTPISAFGQNGVLDLSDTAADDYTLAAGRYIAEVKLTDDEGNISFRREVVEIWADTTTDFVFAPDADAFVDPSVALVESGASLSETDTKINNIAITGAWTGNGNSEQNPRTYTYSTPNTGSVSIELVFEPNSQYTTISWAPTTGAAPSAYSTEAFPSTFDFLTNNTLWIKVVSEDGSSTRYYKFAVTPPPPPSNGSFTDTDYRAGYIKGTIGWTNPGDLGGITGYRIYFGSNTTTKLPSYPDSVYNIINTSITSQNVPDETMLPTGAKYYLIYSANGTSDYPDCLAIPIYDLAMTPTSYGSFTVTGTNPAGIAYTVPNLIITQSGYYHITGNGETTDRIQVVGGNISADIVINNVNINVSGTSDAVAFDANTDNNEGVTVNLTINGTNTLRSGGNKAGFHVPANTTLVIGGTGSLSVAGGNYGAGIGGNDADGAGTITINNGTVTANGGQYGTGIGGGRNGAGGTITITSGMVTANGSAGASSGGNGSNGIYGEGISISGGTVTATGGNGGSFSSSANGGVGGNGSNGIYGERISISGGTVTATGGNGGNGGSGGRSGQGGSGIYGQTVDIEGGIVTVNGGRSGESYQSFYGGSNYGGRGGDGIYGQIIDIEGGIITVNGGEGGWVDTGGIGGNGGNGISGDTIRIQDSTITASAGNGRYGSSSGGNGGNGINVGAISIQGSTLTINGGNGGGSSSSGSYGSGGYGIYNNTRNIEDSTVIAYGGSHGNGSGGANGINNYTLTTVQNGVIAFNGNDGIMYGDVSLRLNHTIPAGKKLVIRNGQTLTIESGYTLTNNGIIIIEDGNTVGTILGNQPIRPEFTVSGNSGYTYTQGTNGEGILTLTGTGPYTIGMKPGITDTTTNCIVVASGVNADITLSDVNINVSGTSNACAFDITGATVNLTLVGENVLRSGSTKAGLLAPSGATLLITEASTGSLTAAGGSAGAGIGGSGSITSGGTGVAGGTITITGGTVIATGGGGGAGIGGGGENSYYGGGRGGAGGIITISGGTVTATGGSGNAGGAGIGGGGVYNGTGGSGGIITITGGTVTATGSGESYSGYGSAGIGGGHGGGAGGTISITGGTVTAAGGGNTRGGAGIGGSGGSGNGGAGGTISISGGTVTATGRGNGAGIGGGRDGASGTITAINGNAVIFASSIQPALPSGGNLGPAIVFNGNSGNLYGNFTLWRDLAIDAARTLNIPADGTLTIGSWTLQNDGTINVASGGVINGTVSGNQPNME